MRSYCNAFWLYGRLLARLRVIHNKRVRFDKNPNENCTARPPCSRNLVRETFVAHAVDWREWSGAPCLDGAPLGLLRSFGSPGVHLFNRYGNVIDPTRLLRRRLLRRTAAEAQQEQAQGNTRCRFHQWSFAAFCVIRQASVMPSSVGAVAPCSKA